MHKQQKEQLPDYWWAPNKSWSLYKSTPRTQQVDFTIKMQKDSFI
jgi:hypothetical protein